MSSFVLIVCVCVYVFADFVTKIEFVTPHISVYRYQLLHKLA